MKGILNTFLISAASLLLFSCEYKESFEVSVGGEIILDLSSGITKATVEDTQTESFVNHLDVFIFSDNAGAPSAVEYYGRYTVNNASHITLGAKRSSFEENTPYHIFLIANSNISETDFRSILDTEGYDGLIGKKQEDELLHLTGLDVKDAPKYFLMDAALHGIDLNNGNSADNTEISATLSRAAAKVFVNITAGEKVEFKSFTIEQGSEGARYYIRNLPYNAFLFAEAKDDADVKAAVRNTAKEGDKHFSWDPSTDNKNVTLLTYVYPNSWSEGSLLENETCVIMNLPMVFTPGAGEEPVEYHNSWYKIHMTAEKLIRRNNYYEVNINLNRPGAISEVTPEEIKDVQYIVEIWTGQTIDVGGDDKPSYLQLNQNHVDMYNVNTDDSTLEFASSSPITSIVLNEAYYINYLGQRVDVEDKNQTVYNAIEATAEAEVLSGNITIYSPFVKGDGFEESHSNAIRYMTFTVTNQDGKTQTFTVNQYPTLYITHEMGHYSYRSDFKGTNINGVGEENISGASWNNNGTWSYSATASSSVFFGSKVALGSEGNYTINYAYWGTQSTGGWGPGGGQGSGSGTLRLITSQFGGLYNPRMYHIHVMATSSEYIVAKPRLDADGYTESSAENTMLVSPSFMAASQLGATQRLTGGIDQAKAHCEQYIEVTADGTVYDDWRLPTAAEIDIIIKHQETSDAMATILTEGAYYCAYNTDSNGNVIYTKETGKGTSTTPVRCVRDAY